MNLVLHLLTYARGEGVYAHKLWIGVCCKAILFPEPLLPLSCRMAKQRPLGLSVCYSSTFHWPYTECAQLHWKLINHNFFPDFKFWATCDGCASSGYHHFWAWTWCTKHQESLCLDIWINNTFIDAVISASSTIIMTCLELIWEWEPFEYCTMKVTGLGVHESYRVPFVEIIVWQFLEFI